MAAPPSCPEFSASTSASVSTRPPRAPLTRSAFGFINPSSRAPTICWLSSVNLRCRLTTSAVRNNSSNSTYRTPKASARSDDGWKVQAITFIPIARPNLAISDPMFPVPMIPRVLPCNKMLSIRGQRPAFTSVVKNAARFAAANINPNICSATTGEVLPGWLQTTIPISLVTSKPIISVPIEQVAISRNFGN